MTEQTKTTGVIPNSKASATGPDRDSKMIKSQQNPITADSLDPNFSQKAAASWFEGIAKVPDNQGIV